MGIPKCSISTNMSFFCYFKNIGGHYESWETGVLGPVVLYGLDKGKQDLTRAKWSYQVQCSLVNHYLCCKFELYTNISLTGTLRLV